MLALLIFAEVGRAEPLDTWTWRNPLPTGNEASFDLLSWLPVWTNSFAVALNFADPQSGVYSKRFYHARKSDSP